jgi:endonuclease/exonuclease/phosphatase family metal-dependent hydrolase
MPVAVFVRASTCSVAAGFFCAVALPPLQAETAAPCAPVRVERRVASTVAGPPTRILTIGSLNLAGQPDISDALTEWTAARQIDILLLQEVGHSTLDGAVFVAALSDRLGFHAAYAPANRMGSIHTQGLAIVSRYPLDTVQVLPLAYHQLRFRSRCRIAMMATAAITDNALQLANLHLDTRINSKDRVAQLAPVIEALDGSDGPQLIGGDFNTMNIRWFRTTWPLFFLQRQSAAVAERLGAGGFHTPFHGTPATFKLFHLPLRLDWLYLKRLQPLEWNVDSIPLTDHRGVWARVSIT